MVRSPTTPPPTPNGKPAPNAPFHTQPSDLELLRSYLRPWVESGLKAGAFIHDADVYADEPARLTETFAPAASQDGERAWYFLTPLHRKSEGGKRKSRTVATGEGWWHNEAKSKPVVDGLDGRRHVGYRQSFSFMKKEGSLRIRTGWLMLELRLGDAADPREGGLVLCKVYRSPRHPGTITCPAARDQLPRPERKTNDDERSDAAAGRSQFDGEGSNAATPRITYEAIPDTAAAAARGRKEKAADDNDDSDETWLNSPDSKRKAANDETSVAASAAEHAQSKRKTEGGLHYCPQCGFHLDAVMAAVNAKSSETKSEVGIVQVQGDSLVKDHSFHQFI